MLPGDIGFNWGNNNFDQSKVDGLFREFEIGKYSVFRLWAMSSLDMTHYRVNLNSEIVRYSKYEWTRFIPKTGKGLTRAGMVRINESIRTYIYCVLGSQVLTRSPVIGQSGLSFGAQKEFLALVEDSISTPKGIPDSISRYQDVVSKSRTRLNYVVAPGLYLMSDNLVTHMPNIPGYNNDLIIAG